MQPTFIPGSKIRQDYIDFFLSKEHTFVPSSSLVPGGDQTLLFTNAGMVQFKDIFLSTDIRPYTRATNSQKCMRVAGKHNDLEDVGRDDTHHTFFEMLGNWSFGDYYKAEAISWAWELLTEVWKIPRENLWVTCFKDEMDQIPQDSEAAEAWRAQPGINPDQILFFGRKDNFWEMAETGPCGPCSEIHIDRGVEFCDKQHLPGHKCVVNGDCARFLELWNLVFIQYNRLSPDRLEPLPAKHVDTGLGLERIVSILQNVSSNYRTDLLSPMMDTVQNITGHSNNERELFFTPYRVIADHSRAATFLIADGVVPGNTGRNYVCRMIIRRAARFGSKIGLNQPFLAQVAETVISNYGNFYPELVKNQDAILTSITREEERFHRTLEAGSNKLETMLDKLQNNDEQVLSGEKAFELYATYGLPYEISRDIAQERNMQVDETGFHDAMEEHRLASGAGEVFGELGGEDADIFRQLLNQLFESGKLSKDGVQFDPYSCLETKGEILAIFKQGQLVDQAREGEQVEIVIPTTCFYIESGGQVSDTGVICSDDNKWEFTVEAMRKPATGIITHVGRITKGSPSVGDQAIATVDHTRRQDIMRNHTATHLLHYMLREVLGPHARQAGSLVAPDRLRFDFNHSEAVTPNQLEKIELGVNQKILDDFKLNTEYKPLQMALEEGATALFGEKYGNTVRNITIGDLDIFSNELCGGTHVETTGDIGLFLITSEGSAAAGIRRIEAVTGRSAYAFAHRRLKILQETAKILSTTPENVIQKSQNLINELSNVQKQVSSLEQKMTEIVFEQALENCKKVNDINLLTLKFSNTQPNTLRQMIDKFRERHSNSGVVVLASVNDDKPIVIAAITNDLVSRGFHAGELVKFLAEKLGGSGGGKPTLAQAGGKDPGMLDQALECVENWIQEKF